MREGVWRGWEGGKKVKMVGKVGVGGGVVGRGGGGGGFFFSSRRRHTRSLCDWSSDVCSSDLHVPNTLRSDMQIGINFYIIRVYISHQNFTVTEN